MCGDQERKDDPPEVNYSHPAGSSRPSKILWPRAGNSQVCETVPYRDAWVANGINVFA